MSHYSPGPGSGGGGAGGALIFVASVQVGPTEPGDWLSSITLDISADQDGRDLSLSWGLWSDYSSANNDTLLIRLNGDSGTNYGNARYETDYGSGTVNYTEDVGGQTQWAPSNFYNDHNLSGTKHLGVGQMWIYDYVAAVGLGEKQYDGYGNYVNQISGMQREVSTGVWTGNAITSIQLRPLAGSAFRKGSWASVWKRMWV